MIDIILTVERVILGKSNYDRLYDARIDRPAFVDPEGRGKLEEKNREGRERERDESEVQVSILANRAIAQLSVREHAEFADVLPASAREREMEFGQKPR